MHIQRKIVAGNLYHVLNRGVDKREIFLDDEDRFRFIHDLFEFNDTKLVTNVPYRFLRPNLSPSQGNNIQKKKEPRELLVEILAFCLMPNHYHLFLRPRFNDGVTRFIKRLNMGYAHYFNGKYERNGALFQGRYKSVAVTNEAHFIHLPYYIHMNPLDLFESRWREGEINSYEKAVNFLRGYRWSSHLDYSGIKNFPSVTQRDFLMDFFGGAAKYKEAIVGWLKNMDVASIKDVILE